jgi:hypothetical protein
MFRPNRALLALALVASILAGASIALAQQAPAAPASPTKWVDTLKGEADIQYIMDKATARREKDGSTTIVTKFQVKNMSPKAIARLTIEEFWYDKSGNPVTGDKRFLKKPLMPGEIGEIVLETPKQPNMDRNAFKFSHGNGTVPKPKKVTKF